MQDSAPLSSAEKKNFEAWLSDSKHMFTWVKMASLKMFWPKLGRPPAQKRTDQS